MGPLMILTVQLFTMAAKTSAQFECEGTCYSGRIIPHAKDTFTGKHLKGFSYKNITTNNPIKCYSSCTQDCRCKACQMKGTRCELLEEDKTSKNDSFVAEPGYVYYDLVQTMFKGKSHMLAPNVCLNGCCKSQPCMNGGTCIEHCSNPKTKFTCNCTESFIGSVCQDKGNPRSCLDVLKAATPGTLPPNGFYGIIRDDTGINETFYCIFPSSNRAWTLLESFTKTQFQYLSFSTPYVGHTTDPIDWKQYRLSSSQILYVKKRATVFMATCNFPQRTTTYSDRDYVFGYMSDIDITQDIPTEAQRCNKIAYANIRGYIYTNRSMPVFHYTNVFHIHFDTTVQMCGFPTVPNSISSEDLFGFYWSPNTAFGCTASQQSTTQWWLGQEI